MTEPEHNEVSSPGGGVAGRVAKVVADATVYSRQKLSDHQTKLGVKVFTDATNHVSDEIRSVMGPLFQKVAEHPDTPDEIRPLMQQLATGRGQAWAWIGGTATGAAMGGGLLNLLTNEMNPAVLPLIAANPHGILAPTDAVQAYVRGFISNQFALDDVRKSGLNTDRFNALADMARARPAVGEVIELTRRGEATKEWATQQLRHLGFSGADAAALLELTTTILSPAELAAMWNRDIVDMNTGAREAAKSGVSATDFKRLTELGGDPLSPMDLGEAFRRGFIDSERFRRGIVQGPLRKEWFDVLEKLQFRRMSTVDAASAVTQGHMSLAEGKRVAHENGLEPQDFATLIEIAGRPPGVDFALDALNRGLITQAEFTTMFLESSIKNRYIGLMLEMRTRLIPQETARLLYRNGVYTEQETLSLLEKHGFSTRDAQALMELERVRGDDATRELTRSQIVDMYEERILDLQQTVELLLGLGFTEADAQAMVELADLQRLRKFINAAVTKVRSAYTTGRIDEITASSTLDRLGIPVAQRDDMLAIWDLERTTISKTLTASQIRQAYNKGLIDLNDAMARLTAQGYDDVDAELFLQLTA